MATELHPVKLVASADVVRAYAELTDDFNPIHVDPAFAAKTPLGGCIAHGTLSLGLLWQSLYGTFGVDAGSRVELDVRFVKPVLVGETVEAGGRARAGDAGCFDVWVRGTDGADRIAGTVRLSAREVTA